MRSSVVVALCLVLATGCRVSSGAKTGLIAGGLATGVAGVLVASSGSVDSDGNGVNNNPFNDDWGAYLLGASLVTVGSALLIGGLTAREEHDPLPASAFVYAPARYTPVVAGPPGAVGVSAAGTLAVVEPAGARTALPELAASEQVIRLAQQVRSAASRGDCAGAWVMWEQLDAVDVVYADAVRSGPIMMPCPR